MSINLRTKRFLAVPCMALGIYGVSAAWACVPQPLVTMQPRSSGPSGSSITLQVLSITGRAEIRWNAVDGARLGDGTGPSFSTLIHIPDVPAGLYSIVVLERQPDGSVGSTGRAAFEVTVEPTPSTPSASEPRSPSATASRDGPPSSSPVSLMLIAGGAGLVFVALLAASVRSWRRRGRR